MHELAEAIEAASPPRANTRRVGEWVNELAKEALSDRNRMVARAENWVSDTEIPLKSTPFTAELPLRNSSRPPATEREDEAAELFPPAPPLPTSVSVALASRSSAPPRPPTPPTPVVSSRAPQKAGSRWWVLGLVVLAVAVYFALRSA
jgi:hypothetical protein